MPEAVPTKADIKNDLEIVMKSFSKLLFECHVQALPYLNQSTLNDAEEAFNLLESVWADLYPSQS